MSYIRKMKIKENQLSTSSNDFEELSIRPSLRVWLIYLCIFSSVLLIKVLFMLEEQTFQLLWRGIVSGGIVLLGYIYLAHIYTSYTLNPLEVVGQCGVFSKKVIRIPLNRITNYECRASFLERILGLNNIMLDTPGGSGYELIMSRLSKEDSDYIVEHLRYLMGQQKIAEAGTNEELKSIRKRAVVG